MKAVITGGAGFLGRKLSEALLARGTLAGLEGRGEPVTQITCIDQLEPERPLEGVGYVRGDICDADVLEQAIGDDTASVFHLAAVVSGQAEADFDLGIRVNLDATRALLERCRKLPVPPRFIFASSVAAFGAAPRIVDDNTPVRPLNSYGVAKVIGEYLVGEYARRGWIDGRCFRLPTIVIRPGAPNRAASSFASSILREPLQGRKAICPVAGDLAIWIQSPRTVIANLIAGHELPPEAWEEGLRVLNLPGLTVTVSQMVAGLERAGGDTGLISWEADAAIEAIVGAWPRGMKTARADQLGFRSDGDIDAIIRVFQEDESQPGGESK